MKKKKEAYQTTFPNIEFKEEILQLLNLLLIHTLMVWKVLYFLSGFI